MKTNKLGRSLYDTLSSGKDYTIFSLRLGWDIHLPPLVDRVHKEMRELLRRGVVGFGMDPRGDNLRGHLYRLVRKGDSHEDE